MAFLNLISSFPVAAFQKVDENGRQSYKGDDFFRCPYITSVWDEVESVDDEVPLFIYTKDSGINAFVHDIRLSSLSGMDVRLDNIYNNNFFTGRFKIFAVDQDAIGHEINDALEEVICMRPDIFVDESGVIWIVSENKVYITLDLKYVVILGSGEISEIINAQVAEIVSFVKVKTYFPRINLRMGNGDIKEYVFSADINFNDIKKSRIKAKFQK